VHTDWDRSRGRRPARFPATGDDSDGTDVQRFLNGDPAACAAIDGWIASVVLRRAWRLGDESEACIQDTKLKLLRLLREGAFRGESSLKTYTQAVAKYTCLDALRKRRLRRTEPISGEHLQSTYDNPDVDLERRESARLCYAVLQRLSDPCREIFRMLFDAEMTYQEIADRLEISIGTVKSRIARCRDQAVELRRLLTGGIDTKEG
jgi:RNA polymerase sigma-70 factor (ECF subfamily)